MPTIVLATINARYAHASLGLRYLRANLGPLREDSRIIEFVLGQKTEEMAERLLALGPRIVGFGVYIWNVEETTRLVAVLKRVAPQVTVVVGGPEVSYEIDEQRICALADYVVTGWG
ncbi:MAG: cobalamin-dependent protein, partial [Burkholderiaceae bacterium]|nr:cobalamin-dependent protein [Burkholderiaceae bacterium]